MAGLRAELTAAVAADWLMPGGELDLTLEDWPQTGRLLLLSPAEPGFWAHVTASPEWQDGKPDPLDRWSERVIGALAARFGATALFPFGGPPYAPFHRWVDRSGACWNSPVGLFVHAWMGLWASWRGALLFADLPAISRPTAPRPCEACARPCLTACPAGALTAAGYDLDACHAWLDRPEGQDCRAAGCRVRRACPAGAGYGRVAEQSAYHMRRFHP